MPTSNPVSVSVVMCTYNGVHYVKEQLLSIINQTYPLKEVLIFDDASTDETVAAIQEIAFQYPVMKLHTNKVNLGYNCNFEQALKAATGDVIAPSDQDDVWLPQKIEKMMEVWKPDHPLIYCHSYLTAEIPVKNFVFNPRERRFQGEDGRKIFIHNSISGHALLIRKSFLPLIMPLKKVFYFDWWMALVAAYNGGVQYLPDILVYQRKHNSNLTHFAEDQITPAQYHRRFKMNILNSCEAAATVPNMPQAHKQLALKMSVAVKRSFDSAFYWPLFFLLVRYRKPFFNYKARKIGLFSHIKYAYRITKN